MNPIRSPIKSWKTAATALVLLVIALQALGLQPGWPQDTTPLRIDEEFAKQEKIYRSQGSDIPSGYITYRNLWDYAQLLPPGFCAALSKLGDSDRWLDVGAGDGQAILDYYAAVGDTGSAQKCGLSGAKARAVAVSIEDRRTDKWRQQAATLGEERIRYLSGRRLRQYSREEIGKFQVSTDVYGGFSYTEDLSRFLRNVLTLLEVNGAFYTLMQNVQLETGKEHPSSELQTVLLDPKGRDIKMCSWLKKTTCVKVSCDSKSEWDSPTELIEVRKVCSDVSVPRMKLVHFQAGNPPARRFQLEP